MTARCHWCRHVLGVNEQIANGAVPDAVLPFHIEGRRGGAHPPVRGQAPPVRAQGLQGRVHARERGGRLPALHGGGRARQRRRGGLGEIETRRYTRGSGKNKQTYYDADVWRVQRHVDFTVDDLPLESSASAATSTPAATPTTSSTPSCPSTPRTR
jgi:hypothetical protein